MHANEAPGNHKFQPREKGAGICEYSRQRLRASCTCLGTMHVHAAPVNSNADFSRYGGRRGWWALSVGVHVHRGTIHVHADTQQLLTVRPLIKGGIGISVCWDRVHVHCTTMHLHTNTRQTTNPRTPQGGIGIAVHRGRVHVHRVTRNEA